MASYADPCRGLFLLYDDIDNAIANLLVEVALHLLFEVDDLFCSRAIWQIITVHQQFVWLLSRASADGNSPSAGIKLFSFRLNRARSSFNVGVL